MATISQVLRQIFERLGKPGPEMGWPLYRYRVTADELGQLQSAVQRIVRTSARWHPWEAAGIALLAAETLCRDHASGPWRWETAIGFETSPLQNDDLIDALERYWGREVLRSGRGREVLWSLGREGGFPRKLMVAEEARFSRILRATLRDRERLPKSVLTIDLVGDHETGLPASLRVDGVREILAELVDAVAELRKLEGVAGSTEPIQLLNERNPKWRDALPLRFEDEQAEHLVRGLVRDAVQTAEADPFRFELRLEQTSTGFRVRRRLDLPAQVSAEVMKRAFGGEIPARAQLLVVAEDGLSSTVATVVASGDAKQFRLRERRRPDLGHVRELHFELRSPGQQALVWCNPEGGAAPSDGEPWVFGEDDQGAAIGVGSVNTRAPSVKVVVPSGWRLLPAAEQIGILEEGQVVWRVSVETSLFPPSEKDAFKVRPGVGQPNTGWRLEGQFEQVADRGSRVLKGTPQVLRQYNQHTRRHSGGLEYARVGDAGTWSALDPTVFGEIWLRVREDGVTCLRRRVIRVPSDFEVSLHSAHRLGRIRVSSSRLAAVIAHDLPEGVKATSESRERAIDVRLEADNRPTGLVSLRIQLAHVRPFGIQVPMPLAGSSILGLDRGPVSSEDVLSVDRLLGIRAQAFDTAGTERRYHLIGRAFRPKDTDRSLREPIGRWMVLGELRTERSGWQALPLDEVVPSLRLMLAEAGHMDGEVCLDIEAVGGQSRSRTLARITQYPRVLNVVRAEGTKEIPLRIELEQAEDIALDLDVRPIGEPAHAGLRALPIEGGWTWPEGARHDGAWLITAVESDAHEPVSGARPRMLTIREQAEPLPSATGVLAEAIAATSKTRSAALAAAFKVLAEDPNDFGWNLVDAHLDTLDTLPAITYDAVVALAKCPDAMALATLRRAYAKRLSVLVPAMETLPFAWWAIPSHSWTSALQRMFASWTAIEPLIPGFSARDEIPKLIQALREEGGLFHWIAELLCEAVQPTSKHIALSAALEQDFDGLLRRGAERMWPGLADSVQNLESECERRGCRSKLLWSLVPQRMRDYRDDVTAAPILAAWAARKGQAFGVVELLAYRRIRAFDPDWFESAWGAAMLRFHADAEFSVYFSEPSK